MPGFARGVHTVRRRSPILHSNYHFVIFCGLPQASQPMRHFAIQRNDVRWSEDLVWMADLLFWCRPCASEPPSINRTHASPTSRFLAMLAFHVFPSPLVIRVIWVATYLFRLNCTINYNCPNHFALAVKDLSKTTRYYDAILESFLTMPSPSRNSALIKTASFLFFGRLLLSTISNSFFWILAYPPRSFA